VKYDQFIKHVQEEAQLNSREDAERATRATLETIKERIVGNEASQLAAQLPKELGQYLHGREGEDGGYFKFDEFCQRLSDKEGVEVSVAANHAKAVFTVLQQAVTPGEFADVRANFSDDYEELFVAKSKEQAG
jgi:uncharacterized protein (DUF2267 family)